jgi:hypothetical protein
MVGDGYRTAVVSAVCALPFVLWLRFAIGRSQAHAIQNRREMRLSREVKARFRPPDYHLLNHITLRLKDGTTQIGHILVSRFGTACIKSPRPRSFFHLTFDESEKVGVDPLRIDDCDTVSATLVDFQDRVRNDRWYAAASRTDRHDLIVFAVYDE